MIKVLSIYKIIPILTLLWLISCKSVQTQPLSPIQNPDYDIKIEAKNIEVDELQNVYVVTKDNELIRYNSAHLLVYRYSNDRLGDITSIDVSNPHKILVFYQEFGIIKSLDNTLTETQQIDLNELDLWDIEAVALSQDNNIWLYDPVAFKIKKINESGNILLESYNTLDELNGAIHPEYILEKNNKLIIVDQNSSVLFFDNLSNFLGQTKIPENLEFYSLLNAHEILLKIKSEIQLLDFRTNETSNVFLADMNLNQLLDLEIILNRAYLLFENGILVERLD